VFRAAGNCRQVQPDGILLDYCRYPGTEAEMDPVSQARFVSSHSSLSLRPAAGSNNDEFGRSNGSADGTGGQISGGLRSLQQPADRGLHVGCSRTQGNARLATWPSAATSTCST